LLADKDSFFAKMFSGAWKLEALPDGSYFIDRLVNVRTTQLTGARDGTNFRYILNYMRTGELSIPDGDSFLVNELLKEADFYNLQGFITSMKQTVKPKPTLFPGTTLLTDETHQQKLVKWLPWDNNTNYKLQYKASRDGWGNQTEHFQEVPTVILLLSKKGYLFGGYMSAWSASSGCDSAVFIFTLSNPHGIKPTKFPFNDPGNSSISMHCSGYSFRFHFHGGFEVSEQHCVFDFPGSKRSYSYIDTTGKGAQLFTETKESGRKGHRITYQTKLTDVEVFQCIK
jgi:hypothetical protein